MPATSRSGEVLRAALGEGTRRLALEVEHEPVAVRPEHLAEVVVAVPADGLAAAARAPRGAQAREHVVAARSHGLGRPAGREAAEQGARLCSRFFTRAHEGVGAELLGREGRVSGVARQHAVHAGRDLAEPPQACEERRRVGEGCERRRPSRRARPGTNACRMPSVAVSGVPA